MYLTVINSNPTEEKLPIPNPSGKFTFEKVKISMMSQIPMIFERQFVLNFPLKCDSVESSRSKEDLVSLYAETTDLLFIDFEGIRSIAERDKIVRLFAPYRSVFFESRSCNNLTNFDFKGAIQVDQFTKNDIKKALAFIAENLRRNGISRHVNETLNKPAQFTAPTKRLKILRCEEIGAQITKKDIKDFVFSKNIKGYKPTIRKEVHKMFEELGFIPTGASHEDKVDFIHEPTFTRDYVWFSSSPFTLWHRNPVNNVDIAAAFRSRYKISDFIEFSTVEELASPLSENTTVIKRVIHTPQLSIADTGPGWAAWRDRMAVLCLRSAMGTGKTEMILKALVANPNTMVITPRVSLAAELSTRSGGVLYTNDVVNSKGSIICQFDSLYKMDLRKFKSFIIDEYMTLESHVLNTVSKSHNTENILRLAGILGNPNNQLILMDALLSDNVTDLFTNREIFWVENTFLDPNPLITHKTFESFLKELSKTINRKITVSCVSKEKMRSLGEFLEGFGHKVGLVSSSVIPQERDKILEDFKNNELTALIYTPSLSVGINIPCEVDRHFHYDPGRAVSPIQSIQMMKRARLPAQIDCFIGNTKTPGCLSIDEIRKLVTVDPSLNRFCFTNEYGEPVLTESGKTFCWMKLHDNIWRWSTRESFAYLASKNFKVLNDVEVLGSEEFKGVTFKSFKESLEVWDVNSRRKIIEEIGDHFSKVERYIEPEELQDFISYNTLRRSYEDPIFRTFSKNKASLSGNFQFAKDFEDFADIRDNLMENKEISRRKLKHISTNRLKSFGMEISRSIFGEKVRENEDFAELYQEIWS